LENTGIDNEIFNASLTLQKEVGLAILEVVQNRDKYLDIYLGTEETENSQKTILDVIMSALSKMKAIETYILTTALDILVEQGKDIEGAEPASTMRFLQDFSRDATLSLLLLNNLMTPDEIKGVYTEAEVANAINTYEKSTPEDKMAVSIFDAANELDELVKKHRETKGSLDQG